MKQTRRRELVKDGSHRFKSFVIFMLYQDPNFDVVLILSDQHFVRNGTVRVPLNVMDKFDFQLSASIDQGT